MYIYTIGKGHWPTNFPVSRQSSPPAELELFVWTYRECGRAETLTRVLTLRKRKLNLSFGTFLNNQNS